MISFPLPQTGLPGLQPLLDGDLWKCWSKQGWVPALDRPIDAVRYIRLKRGISCRLTVFPHWNPRHPSDPLHDEMPKGWRVELYPNAERAARAYDKERERADGVFLDTENAAVGIAFPQDRELRSLRHVARSYRLRQTLERSLFDFDSNRNRIQRTGCTATLLAYKPGRRCVFELRGRVQELESREIHPLRVIGKWMKPEIAQKRMSRLNQLQSCLNREGFQPVPRLVGGDPSHGLNLLERVDGTKLRRSGGGEAVMERVGRLLSKVHAGATEDAGQPLMPAMRRTPLAQLAADFAGLAPPFAMRLHHVAEQLEQVEDLTPPAPIHGDLHLGQILSTAAGCRLIDWDQAGSGSPYQDLGSLLAHNIVAGVPVGYSEAFLYGYREALADRPKPDPQSLDLWIAKMLFGRLGDGFRRLEPDWPVRMEQLLSTVEQRLARGNSLSAAQF